MTDATFKAYVDVGTLIVLVVTLLAVLWQGRLIRRTLEADTFVRIQERAEAIKLSETLDQISSWKYVDYKVYEKAVDVGQQIRVRALVDFFNDLSHLARDKYIDDYYPIRLYSPSLLTCQERLLPWWVEGLRSARSNKYLYNNFMALCGYARFWEAKGYKKIGYSTYLKSEEIKEL